MGLFVLFLALPFLCLAFATLKGTPRTARKFLIGLAFVVVIFNGGCAYVASRIGEATGGAGEANWQMLILAELIVVFIWSSFILNSTREP